MSVPEIATLLNDPAFITCVHWKEVGLELGLKKHVLDAIAKDHCMTEDCKIEMLHKWLISDKEATSDKLHRAIETVEGRMWKEKKDSIIKEETQAIGAVAVLGNALDQWEKRNKEIDSERQKLEKQLKNEETWMNDMKRKLKDEKRSWKDRELLDAINRIETALRQGRDYAAVPFVRKFLQTNGFTDQHISAIKDELVVGMLRQHLLETQMRLLHDSVTIFTDPEEVEEHYKKYKQLRAKAYEMSDLLDERSKAYNRILKGLERLGVKAERLQVWHEQSHTFKAMTDEWTTAKEKSKKCYQDVKVTVVKWKQDLSRHIQSLNHNIQQMAAGETGYIQAFLSQGAAVIGTSLGAFVRVMGGSSVVASTVSSYVGTRDSINAQIYADTLNRGQNLLKDINKIFEILS